MSEQRNDDMLSQHDEAAPRKVPANERNRHGGFLFTTNNRGNTTVEECDTDTDQQQNNFLNRLQQKAGLAGSN